MNNWGKFLKKFVLSNFHFTFGFSKNNTHYTPRKGSLYKLSQTKIKPSSWKNSWLDSSGLRISWLDVRVGWGTVRLQFSTRLSRPRRLSLTYDRTLLYITQFRLILRSNITPRSRSTPSRITAEVMREVLVRPLEAGASWFRHVHSASIWFSSAVITI